MGLCDSASLIRDFVDRFPEIARLKNVCWFEAKGEIECSLPPGAYTLSWRMCLADVTGFQSEPAHFTFSKNSLETTGTETSHECKCFIDPRRYVSRLPAEQFPLPTVRAVDAGWTEYDVGDFVVDKGEETCLLRFAVSAIHSGAWKSGLFLDGVVVRPTAVVTQIGGGVGSPRGESGFHTPEFQPEAPEFQFPEAIRRFFTNLPNFRRHWRG